MKIVVGRTNVIYGLQEKPFSFLALGKKLDKSLRWNLFFQNEDIEEAEIEIHTQI